LLSINTFMTQYFHPSDKNLSNLHKAMQYDQYGQPEIRVATRLDSQNVTITPLGNVSVNNWPAVQPISGNVGVTGNVVTVTPTGGTDAFGRLRISTPVSLGDYNHVNGTGNAVMILSTTGSGSGNVNVANSSYTLGVGTGSGDYAIHQSLMYHNYQPGRSQLILASFVLEQFRANTVKRVGYFDDNNGIFLQLNGLGELSFVMRTSTSGSPVDNGVNQLNWNVDPCNGTGPSGFNLQVDKTQLMWVDFQWLGVGRVRVGFVHQGSYILAHEFKAHSNTLNTVYWQQPSLPVRTEIRNTSAAIGVANLQEICSTVLSEGGYIETTKVFNINSSLTGRTIVNGGDTLPVIAIRLKNSVNGFPNRSIVRASQFSMLVENGPIYYELQRFTSHNLITGGSWVSGGIDSAVEYNITATGYSGGQKVVGDYLAAAASKGTTLGGDVSDLGTNKQGFISQNIQSNDSYAYAIVATTLGTQNNINAKVYGSFRWSETV
jgi:hypothetical protein